MDNKKVSELPLNGRQVYMLLQLTSGTLFTQQTFGASGFSGTRAWDVNGSVTIHGSRTGNNEFLIDGASNAGTGGWSYAPPVDAIEEFKVDTASTDASYGRTSGGVVNLTLKSGTNVLHGSATALFRGTALDSNQIQNTLNNISNEGHKYTDGEGMVSGPIKRGKTFFMGGYQGFYEEIPFPSTATVPTDLQRAGDFSQTFNAQGALIQIFDPLTTVCNAQGVCTRTAFANNQIPANRINPVAAALLAQMPAQNTAGTITGTNNFIASPNLGHYRYNSYLMRLDHSFSQAQRLSFSNSGNWGSERRSENSLPPPALRSDNWPTHRNHYLATGDHNMTLGPRTDREHAGVVRSLRRAASQGIRSARIGDAAVQHAVPAHRRAVVPEHQHGRLRQHVRAGHPSNAERHLERAEHAVADDGGAPDEGGRAVPALPDDPHERRQPERQLLVQQRLHAAQRADRRRHRQRARVVPARLSVGRQRGHQRRERSALSELQPVPPGRLEAERADDDQPRAALGLPVGR